MKAKFNVKPKLEICSARNHLHDSKGKKESLEGPHRKNETQNITVRESTEKQTLQKQYSLSGSL